MLVEEEIRGQVNRKEDAEERSVRDRRVERRVLSGSPWTPAIERSGLPIAMAGTHSKGLGGGTEDSRESRSGSEWEGKGLRERQAGCMVQGQNQGSTSVLGFQKAVPDLAEPLPKTSSNPGYLVSEHH